MILYFFCQLFGVTQLPSVFWAKALFALADVSYVTGIVAIAYTLKVYYQKLQRPDLVYARAKVFSEKGDSLKSKHLFLKAGAFKEASREADRLGQMDEALKLAEMSGDYLLQAELLIKARQFERAGNLYETLANYGEAAGAYEKAGNFDKAIRFYERARLFPKLKRLLKDQRRWEPLAAHLVQEYEVLSSRPGIKSQETEEIQKVGYEAAQAYQNAGNFKAAANMYLRLQAHALAGECYEKDGQFLSASDLYRQAGQLGRAAELLLKAKKFHQAAEVYEEMNRPSDVARVLEAAGESTQARLVEAKAAVEKNEIKDAGELFLKAKKYDQAAEIFESQSQWLNAAQAWMKTSNLERAAVAYERGGLLREAGDCYQKLSQFERAARIYQVGKYLNLAAMAYEKAGNYYRAGQILEEGNDVENAIVTYQKASPSSADYWRIQHSLARLFLAKGLQDLSGKILEELVKTLACSPDTLKVFYDHARFLEMSGDLKRAIDVYDKIMAIQFDFKDVLSRRKSLEAKAKL